MKISRNIFLFIFLISTFSVVFADVEPYNFCTDEKASGHKGSYFLDVNGFLDNSLSYNTVGYGTFDVYINGKLEAEGISDYCRGWPLNTKYEIKNIKAKDEKVYNGLYQIESKYSASLSGTLTGTNWIGLKFDTKTYYFDINESIDGENTFFGIEGLTFDVYLNGKLWKSGAMDISENITYGTEYEITNIKLPNGYKYLGQSSIKGIVTGSTSIYLQFSAIYRYTVDCLMDGSSFIKTTDKINAGKTYSLIEKSFDVAKSDSQEFCIGKLKSKESIASKIIT